ncbi:MAG: hypothetical protein JNK82_28015 [Myxococcaceae bacterium]|nr:hypothetical protein [Myxococcaceae bacterium]
MSPFFLCPLLLLACETPPVFPTADVRQNDTAGRIEGDLVVTGAARGNAVVFLYDAAKPPPPTGTGRPLTFTTVSAEQLFGGSEGNGPFTAPFAFSLVKPGSYLVRGLIDTNADFIPWYGVTADSNTGDVGGAAIDPVTRTTRVIDVASTVLDVSVSFADAARVPVDRPAFRVVTQSPSLELRPTMPELVIDLVPEPIDEGPIHQPRPVFLAQLIDEDLDGVPDDRNRDGAPDMWPRVILRKVNDENPLLDDSGDYDHVSGTTRLDPDGVPDVVVLAGAIDPTELLPALIDPTTMRPRPAPVPVTKLKIRVRPRAFDVANPNQPVQLLNLPTGRYAIVLIAPTGQTWRVPNELAPGLASRLGLPEVASQGLVIQVP